MSINHLKSKVQIPEMQMNLLKKQIEAAAGNKKYKSLHELKGVWKSRHLTTDKELTDVQMVLEKDLL